MDSQSSILSLSDDALSLISKFIPLVALTRLLSTSPAVKRRFNAATEHMGTPLPRLKWKAPTEVLERFATPFRNLKSLCLPPIQAIAIEDSNRILTSLLPPSLTHLEVHGASQLFALCNFLEQTYGHIQDADDLRITVRERFRSLLRLKVYTDSTLLTETDKFSLLKYLPALPITTLGFQPPFFWDLLIAILGNETLDVLRITPKLAPIQTDIWRALFLCSTLSRIDLGCQAFDSETASMLPRGIKSLTLSFWRSANVDLSFVDALPPSVTMLEVLGYVNTEGLKLHLPKMNSGIQELRIPAICHDPDSWCLLPRTQSTFQAPTLKSFVGFTEEQLCALPPKLKDLKIGAISPDFLRLLPCASHLVQFTCLIVPNSFKRAPTDPNQPTDEFLELDQATAHAAAIANAAANAAESAANTTESSMDVVQTSDLDMLRSAFAAMTSLEHLSINSSVIPDMIINDVALSVGSRLRTLSVTHWHSARVDLLDFQLPWASRLSSLRVSSCAILDPTIDANIWHTKLPINIVELFLEDTCLSSPALFALLPTYLTHLTIKLDSLHLLDLFSILPRALVHCTLTLKQLDFVHTSSTHFKATVPPAMQSFSLYKILVIVHSTEEGRSQRNGEAEAYAQTQHQTGRSRLTQEFEAFQKEMGALNALWLGMGFYPGCYPCK